VPAELEHVGAEIGVGHQSIMTIQAVVFELGEVEKSLAAAGPMGPMTGLAPDVRQGAAVAALQVRIARGGDEDPRAFMGGRGPALHVVATHAHLRPVVRHHEEPAVTVVVGVVAGRALQLAGPVQFQRRRQPHRRPDLRVLGR